MFENGRQGRASLHLTICLGANLKHIFQKRETYLFYYQNSGAIPKPRIEECRVRERNRFWRVRWTIAPRRSGGEPEEPPLDNFLEADFKHVLKEKTKLFWKQIQNLPTENHSSHDAVHVRAHESFEISFWLPLWSTFPEKENVTLSEANPKTANRKSFLAQCCANSRPWWRLNVILDTTFKHVSRKKKTWECRKQI